METHPGTMQSAEAKLSRSCLMAALRQYTAAVRDMEQTVLLPSLLREVATDDDGRSDGEEAQEGSGKDLYEHYLMLKTLRNTAESSLVSPDERKALGHRHHALSKHLEPLLESDPEVLFHFHLHGIFSVMSNLARKSQSVTSKYLEIVGVTY